MSKYNKKVSCQKCFSAVNFPGLSENAQSSIKTFDFYSKKIRLLNES